MTKIRKLTALTKAGIIESLQVRLGTAVMLFGNLIYLALVYFLWKAVYDSSGVSVVNIDNGFGAAVVACRMLSSRTRSAK